MLQVDLFCAVAIGASLLLLFHYVSKKYQYFLSKPVPCYEPTFLFGSNAPTLLRRTDMCSHVKNLYDAFPDAKIIGLYDFLKPMYMLRNPDMIKKLAIKDFDYFMDHTPNMSSDNSEQPDCHNIFASTLLALRGQKWRDMRATLSPAFTGSKMRHMFELVASCGRSMIDILKSEALSGKRLEYEMKDVFSRFGNDVIATVAFGIKVDSLRDRENQFFVNGKEMLNFQSFSFAIKFILMRLMPWVMQKLKQDNFVSPRLTQYFKGMIIDNIKRREQQGIVRNDMIQILMEVRKGSLKLHKDEQDTKDAGFATVDESQIGKSTTSRVWTEDELIAQCFLFFLAGFDTVSTCLTFLTYELAVNPDIQNRLVEEVLETERSLGGKPLSYEVLQKMEYMDMVVSEGLRKWPPGVVNDRYCVKDYLYDDGAGIRFVVEKGTTLAIPAYAIHRDPKYYPNPDLFEPERFNEENRSTINASAYLPFGVGPRNCIGSRLALMEVKSIIYFLLKDFSLEPTEKTQIPLKLAKSAFTLQSEKGVYVELKPRSS